MSRIFLAVLSIFVAAGCAKTSRSGIISEQLPLTLADLGEIREGEKNHQKVLEEYKLYQSPKLQLYANAIAQSLAEVSIRPHLPYKVHILDSDEVNVFGGPGGYIYITRGLLNFIDSESQLAGVIAHEIAHIAFQEYSNIPHHSKVKTVYGLLLQGSEMAKGAIGSYGTAANYGLKGLGKATPFLVKRFGNDQEIAADEAGIQYLLKAGYDPRGYGEFILKLAQIPMEDVSRFVIYMNTHPPFQDRQTKLAEKLTGVDFEKPEIEFKKDMLNEVRQMTVNAPDSIVFQPEMGVHRLMPVEVDQLQDNKEKKIESFRRRPTAWF